MRKITIILTTFLLSIVSIGQVIACANPFDDPNILRITIVTDGHTINDHSFNESSYNSVLKFKTEFDKWSNSKSLNVPDNLKNKKVVISVVQPASTDLYTIIHGYEVSVAMNSALTVASGFIQYNALVAAQNINLKNMMRYVFVDGDTPNSVVPKANKDLAGILYKAEQSGFLAGLAGVVWLTANNKDYGGLNNLKVSTYGGQNIAAVANYMYGFYWAIKLFNASSKFTTLAQSLLSWVKKLNPEFVGETLPQINFIDLPNQFSGDFNESSNGSKAINSALASKGTQIIFPVSGPQVTDTLAALQNAGNGMVIGVDTDQQKKFPKSANRFITSALKDIYNSVDYMLWRGIGDGYDETDNHNPLPPDEQSHFFKDDAIYKGGKGFTGIADNQAIGPIYQDIISNTELTKPGGFLDQITDGWQKVLAQGSDFWNNGKNNNPFGF